MENLELGTKVRLTEEAKEETYSDMIWKDDDLIIIDKENDNQGLGYIYSFNSISSNSEVTCSLYGYEIELI